MDHGGQKEDSTYISDQDSRSAPNKIRNSVNSIDMDRFEVEIAIGPSHQLAQQISCPNGC
jgi:hypothetical protein